MEVHSHNVILRLWLERSWEGEIVVYLWEWGWLGFVEDIRIQLREIALRALCIADCFRGLSSCDLILGWISISLRAGNRSRRVTRRSKYSQQSVLNALTEG